MPVDGPPRPAPVRQSGPRPSADSGRSRPRAFGRSPTSTTAAPGSSSSGIRDTGCVNRSPWRGVRSHQGWVTTVSVTASVSRQVLSMGRAVLDSAANAPAERAVAVDQSAASTYMATFPRLCDSNGDWNRRATDCCHIVRHICMALESGGEHLRSLDTLRANCIVRTRSGHRHRPMARAIRRHRTNRPDRSASPARDTIADSRRATSPSAPATCSGCCRRNSDCRGACQRYRVEKRTRLCVTDRLGGPIPRRYRCHRTWTALTRTRTRRWECAMPRDRCWP